MSKQTKRFYVCGSYFKTGVGGALLTPESLATEDAEKKMIGSMFIFEASTIEE